uniref:Uncharacterized protein n=1 Tax=Sphaerodactylus townsendi TaxID=933632 RepID=A0ACB8EFT5_9SAUR
MKGYINPNLGCLSISWAIPSPPPSAVCRNKAPAVPGWPDWFLFWTEIGPLLCYSSVFPPGHAHLCKAPALPVLLAFVMRDAIKYFRPNAAASLATVSRLSGTGNRLGVVAGFLLCFVGS